MEDCLKNQELNVKQAVYWETIIINLFQKNIITEKVYRCLKELFAYNKELKILDRVSDGIDEEQVLLQRFETLEQRIKMKLLSNAYVPHNFCKHLDGDFDFAEAIPEAKKEYEKYVKEFEKRAKLYLILKEIYEDHQNELRMSYEKRVKYKKFGKPTGMFGWFYCPNPVTDLVVSNVTREKMYKRTPKDLSGKVEYNYDENGRLLMSKYYRDQEHLRSIEFYVYFPEYIIRIFYSCGFQKESLDYITMQNYDGTLICSYEHIVFDIEGDIYTTEVGTYTYSEKGIDEYWEEHYGFYVEEKPFFLSRNRYLFAYEENGLLCKYLRSEWWGSIKRGGDRKGTWQIISEKKRKDTGREAGRWRKPNYFIE